MVQVKANFVPFKFCTLGPAQNEQIDVKESARCRRVLVVTRPFKIATNNFDAKKSVRCMDPITSQFCVREMNGGGK